MASGREVYSQLQDTIEETCSRYTKVGKQIKKVQTVVRTLSDEQEKIYSDLALLYLPEMEANAVKNTIKEVRGAVQRIFDQQNARRTQLEEMIEDSNTQRKKYQDKITEIAPKYDELTAKKTEVQGKINQELYQNASYVELIKNAKFTEERLKQDARRADAFEEEASKKLVAYESNNLFMYLVNRNFGTSEQKGNNLIKKLDSFVAKVVNFNDNKKNYDFLKAMPEKIQEEIAREQEKANNLKEQGLQFYRTEMKSFCRSRCSIHNKKKLVIIDDIDTINEQSQQVFRNYIDKYKHNVNFIAVCSNIQKIIESIQSRLHILQIPAINREQITNIMKRIITEENLIIDQESKDYLIKNSGNSIRNIINNLEKIFILNGAKDANSIRSNGGILLNDNEAKLGEPVDIHSCRKLCSNISMTHFENFINMILNGKIHDAIENIFGIFDYGYSVIDILDYFFYFVKMTDLLTEEQKYLVLPIICNYTTIFHNIHEDSIELVLFTNELSKILVSSPS